MPERLATESVCVSRQPFLSKQARHTHTHNRFHACESWDGKRHEHSMNAFLPHSLSLVLLPCPGNH